MEKRCLCINQSFESYIGGAKFGEVQWNGLFQQLEHEILRVFGRSTSRYLYDIPRSLCWQSKFLYELLIFFGRLYPQTIFQRRKAKDFICNGWFTVGSKSGSNVTSCHIGESGSIFWWACYRWFIFYFFYAKERLINLWYYYCVN